MDKISQQLIALLINQERVTIPGLAEALGISIGTATKAVVTLQEDGLVQDAGKADTGSGRKPHCYTLVPEAGYYAGIDLNDKFVSFGLMDMAGSLVRERINVAYKLENTPASLRTLCEIVREFRSRIPGYLDKLRHVCVNIPGRVNPLTGYSHTNFNFTQRPLADIFTEQFGVPTSICNDTLAMTYAEYLKGCTDGERNLVLVNVNWGLGIGLILDGRPYLGKSGYAGEFGHIHAFDNQIICRCGKKGCLETEVSGQALRRKLTERIRGGESSILSERVLGSDQPLSLEEISEAVRQEDTLCIEVIEEIGSLLGIQVAGLINVFNPELVVIGGELAMTGDYLLQPLKTAVHRHALTLATRDTTIRGSRMGVQAGVTGGCLLARSFDFGLR